MTEPLQVVWFKRDLRVADHRPLSAAVARGPVLPLYVVEPDYWALPDTSERQFLFIRESLSELQADLAALGQPLIVRVGDVIETLETIRASHGIAGLWSHQETGNGWTFDRDIAVGRWCRGQGIPWMEERQDGVIRRLRSRDGWARAWDRFMAEPLTPPPAALPPVAGIEPGAIPEARDLGLAPDGATERQQGGRTGAEGLLTSFLFERGEPYRRAMASPLEGADACSRLSPHLAYGTVSMREVAQGAWTRQRELKAAPPRTTGGWRGSVSSFTARLHWRCHFMQKLEDEPAIEHKNFHSAYDGLRDAAVGSPLLEAWAAGETGYPFLDACMRSLTATGWLNFRMRAMVMAISSYHLWLHWRRPGEHLARMFTDYEPGIHWSQVQMQSGTTGINAVRVYNPVKQSYTQDPDGLFIRRWLPELEGVPDAFIHEPWKWGDGGGIVGEAYPQPIFDHAAAARAAKERIWAVRKGAGHREVSNGIFEKHGSRKSGVPQGMPRASTRRSGRGAKPPACDQLSLFD